MPELNKQIVAVFYFPIKRIQAAFLNKGFRTSAADCRIVNRNFRRIEKTADDLPPARLRVGFFRIALYRGIPDDINCCRLGFAYRNRNENAKEERAKNPLFHFISQVLAN